MITIETACHRALLEPVAGCGRLVCPRPDEDVPDPGTAGRSLYGEDWRRMLGQLIGDGWRLLDEDDTYYPDGMPVRPFIVGQMGDGREVLALSRTPEDPGEMRYFEAANALNDALGLDS